MQTVYDVFAVAPLGAGVVDSTAGSALVTGYFTGQELKRLLEFFLIDSPAHPGEYFPRASGMRFRYDPSRPKFDVVTAIELGDLDHGYHAIDITGKDEKLYSLTCPLMLGPIIVAIPKYTKGKLPLVPKNRAGRPLTSRVEALNALAATQVICCRRRARWTRTVSPPRQRKVVSGRSRNGRRSWIIFAACRSRGRANCPRSHSTSVLQRFGRSKWVEWRIPCPCRCLIIPSHCRTCQKTTHFRDNTDRLESCPTFLRDRSLRDHHQHVFQTRFFLGAGAHPHLAAIGRTQCRNAECATPSSDSLTYFSA